MAIWGHHIGLQQMDSAALRSLSPEKLAKQQPLNLRLSHPSVDELKARLESDGLRVTKPQAFVYDQGVDPSGQMLDVRLLFSALVDADFLDTARHFGEERPTGPPLEPEKALPVLERYIQSLRAQAQSSSAVQQMRNMLWESCMSAADGPTATQPAFCHLHDEIQKSGNIGWMPREIVQDVSKLFHLSRRTAVVRRDSQPVSWEELAEELRQHKQALCVVNIKRHAKVLASLLRQNSAAPHVFHLPTLMCPAHRQVVLEEVRRRLKNNEPCLLISTQCVEAGVDVDFPVVYRALAPLDSIAQAAGRCNRNGRWQTGEVILFVPEEEKYPPGAYQQATSVTKAYLASLSGVDLHSAGFYDGYYRLLYDITRPENLNKDLDNHIQAKNFPEVARLYRLIPDVTINVLVSYDQHAYESLADEARQRGLTG